MNILFLQLAPLSKLNMFAFLPVLVYDTSSQAERNEEIFEKYLGNLIVIITLIETFACLQRRGFEMLGHN